MAFQVLVLWALCVLFLINNKILYIGVGFVVVAIVALYVCHKSEQTAQQRNADFVKPVKLVLSFKDFQWTFTFRSVSVAAKPTDQPTNQPNQQREPSERQQSEHVRAHAHAGKYMCMCVRMLVLLVKQFGSTCS